MQHVTWADETGYGNIASMYTHTHTHTHKHTHTHYVLKLMYAMTPTMGTARKRVVCEVLVRQGLQMEGAISPRREATKWY